MTDRVLPAEEWSRLAGTELAPALAHLDARTASIVVVEDDAGQIVGCWALLRLLHAEGVWIDPQYRGRGSVARRLWRRMKALVYAEGATSVLTGAASPEIRALLDRQRAQPIAAQEYLLCL